MPFTLAHPAAIVPLYQAFKNRLSLTGLIIGSIVPDVEYCVNLFTRSVISHTFEGIFIFNLPVGIFLTVCYHAFIKQTLIFQLPDFIKKIFASYSYSNWFSYFIKHPLTYFISLFIGIILHLVWDSVTHPNGYFVIRQAWLSYPLLNSYFTVSRLLWHISTWIGLYFVYRFLRSFSNNSDAIPDHRIKNYWALVYLAGCAYMFFLWLPFLRPQEARYVFIALAGSTLFGITIISFIFRLIYFNRK